MMDLLPLQPPHLLFLLLFLPSFLTTGSEIAVATPGRMMDLLRMKACTAGRITYLVLDEADRMFDMGFGEQVGTDERQLV
jgi:hypothetical protein